MINHEVSVSWKNENTLSVEVRPILRREGYYWVKDGDGWRAHHFDGKEWAEIEGYGSLMPDEWWLEINENRIPEPGEPVVLHHNQKIQLSANGLIFTLNLK